MIKNILLFLSGFVAVQSQLYASPYQRQCSCGQPAIPAILQSNPCGNPVSLPLPIYDVPLQAPRGKVPVFAAPYEVPLVPFASKGPVLAPYETQLPVALPVPAPAPRVVAKPACGCLDVPVPQYDVPLPYGLPLPNPFLPAASPVSALAPFNPLLPPASPCSKCQYLKKIPIPPPCI